MFEPSQSAFAIPCSVIRVSLVPLKPYFEGFAIYCIMRTASAIFTSPSQFESPASFFAVTCCEGVVTVVSSTGVVVVVVTVVLAVVVTVVVVVLLGASVVVVVVVVVTTGFEVVTVPPVEPPFLPPSRLLPSDDA